MVKFEDDVIDLFKQCKYAQIDVSIDGLPSYNDYQRAGADFERIWSNSKVYHDMVDDVLHVSVSSAVGIYTIPAIHLFIDKVTIDLPRAIHTINMIGTPAEQFVGNLPNWYKDELIGMLYEWVPVGMTDGAVHETDYVSLKKTLIRSLESTSMSTISKMRYHTEILDRINGQSLFDLDQTLYNAIFQSDRISGAPGGT